MSAFIVHADDWQTKRRWGWEIAAGMTFVHSLGRMHRDLKSGNILAAAIPGPKPRVVLKVADFGTATLAGHAAAAVCSDRDSSPANDVQSKFSAESQLTQGIGTPVWMAPEILLRRPYGPSADVYSFAIVLWEIAAQAQPWAHLPGAGLIVLKHLRPLIEAGQRPQIGAHWPADFARVMISCWHQDPDARPVFAEAQLALQPDAPVSSEGTDGNSAPTPPS